MGQGGLPLAAGYVLLGIALHCLGFRLEAGAAWARWDCDLQEGALSPVPLPSPLSSSILNLPPESQGQVPFMECE